MLGVSRAHRCSVGCHWVTLSGDPETRVSVCGIPAVSHWDPACHTSGEEPSQTSTCQPRLGLARTIVRSLDTIQDRARYIPHIMVARGLSASVQELRTAALLGQGKGVPFPINKLTAR